MVGRTFYQSVQGMPYKDFIEKYRDELHNKVGVYVIQSNLEGDQATQTRVTRNRNYEQSVIKFGRTNTGFSARFASYATQYGSNRTSLTDQSGLRILYVKFLDRKDPLKNGKSQTDIFEKQILNKLRREYGLLEDRGVERFKINIPELFDIINNYKIDMSDESSEYLRRSERLGSGIRLMWVTIDSFDNTKTYINFHPDFDEIIEKYTKGSLRHKDQIGKSKAGILGRHSPTFGRHSPTFGRHSPTFGSVLTSGMVPSKKSETEDILLETARLLEDNQRVTRSQTKGKLRQTRGRV